MQWWDEVLVLQHVENFCHALPRRGGHRKPSTYSPISSYCYVQPSPLPSTWDGTYRLRYANVLALARQRSQISHIYRLDVSLGSFAISRRGLTLFHSRSIRW